MPCETSQSGIHLPPTEIIHPANLDSPALAKTKEEEYVSGMGVEILWIAGAICGRHGCMN
jgi:hypothetical protein